MFITRLCSLLSASCDRSIRIYWEKCLSQYQERVNVNVICQDGISWIISTDLLRFCRFRPVYHIKKSYWIIFVLHEAAINKSLRINCFVCFCYYWSNKIFGNNWKKFEYFSWQFQSQRVEAHFCSSEMCLKVVEVFNMFTNSVAHSWSDDSWLLAE